MLEGSSQSKQSEVTHYQNYKLTNDVKEFDPLSQFNYKHVQALFTITCQKQPDLAYFTCTLAITHILQVTLQYIQPLPKERPGREPVRDQSGLSGLDRASASLLCMHSTIKVCSRHQTNKSKDTIGEQVIISARSLTPLHQRTEWKMRRRARKKDATICPITPLPRHTLQHPELNWSETNKSGTMKHMSRAYNCNNFVLVPFSVKHFVTAVTQHK